MKKGRRSNGEGSVYEFIQKIKKDNSNLEICETCKNCNNKNLCNNREDCKKLCDKCKQCINCLKYCDRYYIYERSVSQATKKDGTRTTPKYAKKKKDAAKNNLDTINKINNDAIVDKSKITLYDIAKSIVEDRHDKNITTDNSYIANLAKLNRLGQHEFMNKPAQEVTDNDIHKYLKYITSYSDSVIGKDYGLLNATFIKAVRKKILILNPLDDKDEFRRPKSKCKTEKVKAFTISEQKKFIESIKKETSNKYKLAWLLMLNLGLRPGEVYAIDINNINFAENKIYIKNTLTHDKNGKTILGDTTKTYSGDRIIDLNNDAKLIIKELLAQRKENKYNLLFWDNNFISINTYFDAFAEYKNKYNAKSENYLNELGLNYSKLDQDKIISIELNKLKQSVSNTCLDDLDKKVLYEVLDKIKNKYNLFQEKTS